MTSDEMTAAFTKAVQNEISDSKQKGLPIARYDASSKKAYLEHADGIREYINE